MAIARYRSTVLGRILGVSVACAGALLLAIVPARPRLAVPKPTVGPVVEWSQQIGEDWTSPMAIALDAADHCYVGGATGGDALARNAGGHDGFLAKYTAGGHRLWSRRFRRRADGEDSDVAGLRFRSGGGVLATGQFSSSVGMMEFRPSGVTLRQKRFGWAAGNSYGNDISVDRTGSIYVVGSDNTDAPSADLYKFTSGWRLLWHKQLPYSIHGDNYSTSANALDLDGQGNLYVVGGEDDDVTCGFLTKLTPNGRELWRQDLNRMHAYALAVRVAPGGALYVGGGFGRGGGLFAKYSAGGKQIWLKHLPTGPLGAAASLALDKRGNVYLAGHAGPGRFAKSTRAVVMKCDAQGRLIWSKQLCPTRPSYASGVAVDGQGGVYVCGTEIGTSGRARGFLVKLKQ